MRITQGLLTNNLLYDLRQSGERLQKAEEQLSTLRQVNRPSDDPVGTVSALRLRNQITDINRYGANIKDAQSWLNATESSLSSVSSAINRAIVAATQANTGSLNASARDALSQQVDSLIREAADVANERFQGRAVFGGHRTSEDAAILTESAGFVVAVDIATDDGAVHRQIGQATTMKINNTASQVFGQAGSGLFSDLIALRSAVLSGDSAQLGSIIERLQVHDDRVLGLRAEAGAKSSRLEADTSRHETAKLQAQELLSQIEDTDVARASIQLSAASNAYEATLAVGAKIIMPTLLDFLK